jgi:hypothetical protein
MSFILSFFSLILFLAGLFLIFFGLDVEAASKTSIGQIHGINSITAGSVLLVGGLVLSALLRIESAIYATHKD